MHGRICPASDLRECGWDHRYTDIFMREVFVNH
jgi:hypothetical protein